METEKYILALGFFDGVHLGHGALLRACREMADRLGAHAGVVTFSDHPDTLVSGSSPELICGRQDKLSLMKTLYGMETVIFLPFDRRMMTMPWQEFFHLLRCRYHAVGLVCGEDFRFGDRGAGSAALLRQICGENGMECAVIPQQRLDGAVISSTYIRELLKRGEMERACRFLGHPHLLSGRVVRGQRIGRTIGIPTANIQPEEPVLELYHGVYACKAVCEGREYPAVVNVGSRPTVDGSRVTVEAWLPDFSGDLYGKTVALYFHRFLRPERKFENLTALQAEIRKNAAETRKFFEET